MLGTYLKALEPGWTIHMYERLEKRRKKLQRLEQCQHWPCRFCELNYTTLTPAGTMDITKAVAVNEFFEISRQLWAYLIKQQILTNPHTFIKDVPHMSFVWGEDNICFCVSASMRYKPVRCFAVWATLKIPSKSACEHRWLWTGAIPSKKWPPPAWTWAPT
ncbi:MAG: malate:quinone oxidoreductase [Sodalis sp.]|uniref:malate:quinone oxidoreductase n=1 Tax=Sodalis sp. (in: enterobacteria) TaxID=1898979 RepID=UPI0038739F34|nr:MAG: malate:quinone oxidoreductase [Sodalis sp.]